MVRPIDLQALEQWAETHQVDSLIAEAIFFLAENDDEVERIWQDPTREELIAIYERSTQNGLLDASDLIWAGENLEHIVYGQDNDEIPEPEPVSYSWLILGKPHCD